MRQVLTLLFALYLLVFLAMTLIPLGEFEWIKAIGPTAGLPESIQRAFYPGSDFLQMENPQPGDWLAEHPERGQTFPEFAKSGYNRPDSTRWKIYLQPMGTFREDGSPSLDILREYACAYFAMEVKVLPALSLEGERFATRINAFTGKQQILTTDVFNLLRTSLPPDAFCILAITMEDLYPDPTWNFVFGQASLTERIGVYSFARYDPAFHNEKRGADYREVLLKRSCRVLAHETGHMFGLVHCVFFKCIMNGSNHLKESDSRPLHLCPVCLRKMQDSIGFDIVERYRNLAGFYRKHGFNEEAQWIQNRLNFITGNSM